MKKLYIILFLFVSSLSLHSQIWVQQTPPAIVPLNTVHAVSVDVCWIGGMNKTVFYTSNGGTNWFSRGTPLFNGDVYTIFGIGTDTAICGVNGTQGAQAWRTTNRGITWTSFLNQPGGFINGVKFINATTGYMVGDPVNNRWSLWRSLNTGVFWDTTGLRLAENSALGWNNSFEVFYNGNVSSLWFGTDATGLFYSSNNGTSWSFASTPGNGDVYAIVFSNALTGFCGGSVGGFKSTNGSNFTVFPIPGGGAIRAFGFANNQYWCTRGNRIYWSPNNGVSFNALQQHTSPSGGSYTHISMTTIGTLDNATFASGWGVTNDGIISKYTGEGIGIHNISNEVPNGFRLEQNYPNPFNPSAKIRFQIAKSGFVNLIVFDALGREVTNIVNQSMQPGTYEADFNGTNLSSGIYYYILKSGNFTETKKMAIIK